MIELRGITRRFGTLTAVDNVHLTIGEGEFLTLLGPSGCGKTTLLRTISGFETPDEGSVFLNGRDVTLLPPYRRDVNQVFQSYALFPHMTVRDNIAFGLRAQKVSRHETRDRVADALRMVNLEGLDSRKPAQLSGGQQQRVALARAIVCRPRVLLLDEPLAALDARLRQAMQVELKHLQQRLGITFVLVTHDQHEALVMSDRVAVMNAGRIEHIGTPDAVYRRPATAFAANFVGQANVWRARVVERIGPRAIVAVDGGPTLDLPASQLRQAAEHVRLLVRPERLRISADAASPASFPAQLVESFFTGPTRELRLVTDGGLKMTAVVLNDGSRGDWAPGARVHCAFDVVDVVVLGDAGAPSGDAIDGRS